MPEFEGEFDPGEKLFTGAYLVYAAWRQERAGGSAEILKRVGEALRNYLEGTND
jgi:hypothetical protein